MKERYGCEVDRSSISKILKNKEKIREYLNNKSEDTVRVKGDKRALPTEDKRRVKKQTWVGSITLYLCIWYVNNILVGLSSAGISFLKYVFDGYLNKC